MYAVECAPTPIRGAVATMWQAWTAFGSIVGFAATLAVYNVEVLNIEGLNWRLMLASVSTTQFIFKQRLRSHFRPASQLSLL